MQLGDQLEIVLPGNPGTGYGWEVVSDSAQNVQQVGEPEFKADTNLLDSPGNITLRFRAVSKGEQNLQLIYHRPWEKGVAPLNTYEITVNVK
jgi:inhibitor of cysteine peptidase